MQSRTYEQARQLGAVLKFEINPNYTRGSGIFTNDGDEAVNLQPGVIFTGGAAPSVFDTAEPAAFSGICITTDVVEPGASVEVVWAENGPAIINTNEVDFPADADQRTTLETALTAANFKLVAGFN